MAPKLNGIDHVHVYVSDRAASARWYEKVLGFEVAAEFESWATEGGPLTMRDESDTVHIALFQSSKDPDSVIAFNTDAASFLEWKSHLENHDLEVRFADHELACSLYFHDPDGNYHEITTYDHKDVRNKLSA